MKNNFILSILSILLASLFLVVSCGKDKVSYDENEDSGLSGSDDEYGYLIIPSALYVDLTSENFNMTATTTKSDEGDEASSLVEASDNYLVTITDKRTGEVAYDKTYGDLKQLESLALTPATYSVYVRSTDEVPGVGTEAHFSGSADVTIVSGYNTEFSGLQCTMCNIKASLSVNINMLNLFMADEDVTEESQKLTITISMGDEAVATFNSSNWGEAYYFCAVDDSNTLDITLSGMYNTAAGDEPEAYTMINGWKQSLSDVKAGQWRNIELNVAYATEGTVDFTITVDSWTYDDTIDVDITSSTIQYVLAEEELDDPENYITDAGAPVVTIGTDYSSIDETFSISKYSFSTNETLEVYCSNPLIVNVEPEATSTISSMWVEVSSNNSSLMTKIKSELGDKARLYVEQGAESDYWSQSGNTFTTSYEAMYALYIYAGEHTLTIMVEDSEGRASFSTLNIVSSNDGVEVPTVPAPTIVWVGGYELDSVVDGIDGDAYTVTPYEVTNDLEIVIQVSSESGITGFTMEIISDTLTEAELNGIYLSNNMDLINPDEYYVENLSGLGFPTGDDVKGQTYLEFDITSFMAQLQVVGTGISNFVLHVTNEGGTTTRTIRVEVK